MISCIETMTLTDRLVETIVQETILSSTVARSELLDAASDVYQNFRKANEMPHDRTLLGQRLYRVALRYAAVRLCSLFPKEIGCPIS